LGVIVLAVSRISIPYRPKGQFVGVEVVQPDANVLVETLIWGAKWTNTYGGTLVIPVSIYASFAGSNGTFVPNSIEIEAVQNTVDIYQNYIATKFILNAPSTDFRHGIWFNISRNSAQGSFGFSDMPGSQLFQNVSYSNISIYRGNYLGGPQSTIKPGSADFSTFLHEFGHSLGLNHPHDVEKFGGRVSLPFPAVKYPFGSLGTFDLNQGVNTIMSYSNGWQTGPLGASTSTEFGYAATPMALDILALQRLYGANLSYHLGDDQYQLSNLNGGYSCIWDASGNDTIIGAANLSNNIDLRAATGLVEQGGGGWVSYVSGLQGGFTIAVGAVIENAKGGNFADVITGNNSANHITGGGGADILTGGNNRDFFIYNSASDSTTSQMDLIKDFVENYDQLDFSAIDANTNLIGDQTFQLVSSFTAAGQVRFVDNGIDTLIYANINSDLAADFCIKLVGHHVLTTSDFIL
jgi:serralysin